jgi:hypothetical protein
MIQDFGTLRSAINSRLSACIECEATVFLSPTEPRPSRHGDPSRFRDPITISIGIAT